jgi:hypothetical protein
MHYSMTNLKLVEAAAGLLLIAFLHTKCKKEYSFEGGTAEFTLLNVNGSCVNPVISGDYIIGSALGSSNTVQLQVDVTTTGEYSLQTNSRSGFLFSTTGSFSDTGIQTLTLTATGKPDSTGDFIFIPEIAATCGFSVSVTGQQVPQTGYTIVGAPNACSNVQVSGNYQKGQLLTGSNTVMVYVNVVSPGDYTIQSDTLDGISFYASGHFNQPGNQIVTLTGSGTPVLPQNLQFNLVGNGSACSFPLTVENAGDSATYSIASGVDHCVGQIAGAYTAGTPLNASNTFTLTVYVSVAGIFSISTQTVNGIVFSYTGRFTRLGTNFVTLTGHGTPTNVGSFTLTPEIIGPAPLGGQSCDFLLPVK